MTRLARKQRPPSTGTSLGAFNCGGPIQVCLSLYLYGDRAAAAITRDQPLWQQWMSERFPSGMPA
jgi:hypothetical protein